jgi:hypothetical protein
MIEIETLFVYEIAAAYPPAMDCIVFANKQFVIAD